MNRFKASHLFKMFVLADSKRYLSLGNRTAIRKQTSCVGFADNILRIEFFFTIICSSCD
jgi:hypothetical protein